METAKETAPLEVVDSGSEDPVKRGKKKKQKEPKEPKVFKEPKKEEKIEKEAAESAEPRKRLRKLSGDLDDTAVEPNVASELEPTEITLNELELFMNEIEAGTKKLDATGQEMHDSHEPMLEALEDDKTRKAPSEEGKKDKTEQKAAGREDCRSR